MAKLLKLRRGTTSQHSSFTGAEGEVTVDTDKETLVVHDGSTAGGHPVAAEDMANVSSASIAGRLGTDSIATTKIAAGALPTDVTVASANIVNGTILTEDLAANAVNADKLADNAVTSAKLASNAVTTERINANAVTTAKILNGNVTTAKFADDAVTYAKMQNVSATDRVLGRDSSGAGVVEEITPANLRTMINVEDGATADQSNAEIRAAVEAASDSNVFTDADHSKLNGIEASATADQSASEIRTLVESASDSNVFTDADHSKLNGIAASATNVTNNNQLTNGASYVTSSVINSLNASNLSSGTIPDARFPATLPAVSGANLTGIVSFVQGMILIWSGSTGSIPSGWVLCNGSNGTPDLRDRFVVGAGSSYNVSATGGANTVTLSANQITSHSHSFSATGNANSGNQSANHSHGDGNLSSANAGGHSHGSGNYSSSNTGAHSHGLSGNTSNSGNHTHTQTTTETAGNAPNSAPWNPHRSSKKGYPWDINTSNATDTNGGGDHSHSLSGNTTNTGNHSHNMSGNSGSVNDHSHNVSGNTGNQSANHTHSVSVSVSGNTGNSGNTASHENRPPYYALCYIMKS